MWRKEPIIIMFPDSFYSLFWDKIASAFNDNLFIHLTKDQEL